jgi:hypothetical protein
MSDDASKQRPFEHLPDGWLDDIACAVQSAAGEGAFGNETMAGALAAEYKTRERMVPMAYSDRLVEPSEWVGYLQ